MGAAGGGSSRPTYTRAGGNLLGEGKLPFNMSLDQISQLPGFLGDVGQAQGLLPIAQLFQNAPDLLNAAVQGGATLRDLGSQATDQAYNASSGLSQQAANMAGQNLDPSGYINAAQQISQNINRGAQGLQGGLAGANQVFQNSMDPNEMNPFFNAEFDRQAQALDASAAARGLGSSGENLAMRSELARNLNSDFGQRQMQQQLGALGQIQGFGGALGNLGVQGALAPGQVYNQFESGLGQGIQNVGAANQQQMLPQQVLGTGGALFQQGLDIPFQGMSNLYNLTRGPLEAYANFINGVPSIGGQQKGFFSSFFS